MKAKLKLTYYEARLLGQFIVAGVMSLTGDGPADSFRPFNHFDWLRKKIGKDNVKKAQRNLSAKNILSSVLKKSRRGLLCLSEDLAIDCYDAICGVREPDFFEKTGDWPK